MNATTPPPADNTPLGWAARMKTAGRSPGRSALAAPTPSAVVHTHETNVNPDRDLWGGIVPRRPVPTPRPKVDPNNRWMTGKEEAQFYAKYGYNSYSVQPATPRETLWRHSGWLPRRAKVRAALLRTAANEGRRDRFQACGSACRVERSPSTGLVRTSSNHCHDRWCQVCGATRSRLIAANLERHLGQREARFVTLTLKHTATPLAAQITRLLKCFRALRRHHVWKNSVTGGAAFVEVKRSKSGKHWHPHLHVLCEGSFLSHPLLSAAWMTTTGNSSIVDVRYVREATAVVRYVAKYASKPLDATLYERPAWLDEAIIALKGRRLCTTFGKWRGIELEEQPESPQDWVPVCGLNDLIEAQRAGETWAIALYAQLRRLDPEDARRPWGSEDSS